MPFFYVGDYDERGSRNAVGIMRLNNEINIKFVVLGSQWNNLVLWQAVSQRCKCLNLSQFLAWCSQLVGCARIWSKKFSRKLSEYGVLTASPHRC